MPRPLHALLLIALALLAGCTRGPEPARLESDVQARVDELFGRRVLEVESFRRQGSAPYRAADDGAKQVIVYYNARFRMKETYDPSDWQGLGPGMLTSAIGAADEGITGLKAGRNEPGTELRAYGSIVYRADGDGWTPADQPGPRSAAMPAVAGGESDAEEMMRRLSELVQKSPARRGANDAIITEELAQALANIRLRTERGSDRVVVAAGPEGGEYSRFLNSVIGRLNRKAGIEVAATAGSVENALLVDRGDARVGLVQSDVAAAAVTGDGFFTGTGPLGHLRAVASLFPEPVHVVVRADSGIESLADLAGRKVSLGRVASGTRQTALRILEAAGIAADDIAGIEAPTPQQDQTFVRRDEFYNDFLLPNGCRYVVGCRLMQRDGVTAVLGLHRSLRHGPFETADLELFGRLLPHVQRAAMIRQQLLDGRADSALHQAALDRLPTAVFVVTGNGAVLGSVSV